MTLLPVVPYAEVPKHIAIADICVVPLPDIDWWRVSSPLKVYEYLAMGKPVIMTNILPNREIVPNDEDEIFLPDIRPETIAEAIVHARLMPDVLKKMSQKSYEFLRVHFS